MFVCLLTVSVEVPLKTKNQKAKDRRYVGLTQHKMNQCNKSLQVKLLIKSQYMGNQGKHFSCWCQTVFVPLFCSPGLEPNNGAMFCFSSMHLTCPCLKMLANLHKWFPTFSAWPTKHCILTGRTRLWVAEKLHFYHSFYYSVTTSGELTAVLILFHALRR